MNTWQRCDAMIAQKHNKEWTDHWTRLPPTGRIRCPARATGKVGEHWYCNIHYRIAAERNGPQPRCDGVARLAVDDKEQVTMARRRKTDHYWSSHPINSGKLPPSGRYDAPAADRKPSIDPRLLKGMYPDLYESPTPQDKNDAGQPTKDHEDVVP